MRPIHLVPALAVSAALGAPLAASTTAQDCPPPWPERCTDDRLCVEPPAGGNALCNVYTPKEETDYLFYAYDFVPIQRNDCDGDGPGFWVVYSARTNAQGLEPTNNSSIYLFENLDGSVLMFGSGYGDFPQALLCVHCDMKAVDEVIRFRMGRPLGTTIHFVAPHGHMDHINSESIETLRDDFGYGIGSIAFHEDDFELVYPGPSIACMDWSQASVDAFVFLRESGSGWVSDADATGSPGPYRFETVVGRVQFRHRPGHSPGSIDLVLDALGAPKPISVRGSAVPPEYPDLGTYLWDVTIHGNTILVYCAPDCPEEGCPPGGCPPSGNHPCGGGCSLPPPLGG